MRLFRNIPIKRKLTIITMLTSSVAVLLACVSFVIYEQVTFRDTMVKHILTTAAMVADNSSAALSFNDPSSAEMTLKSLSAHPHCMGGAIYDKSGKLFAMYRRAMNDFVPPAVPPPGCAFERDHLSLSQGVALAGETIGTIYLQSDLDELRSRWVRYTQILVVVILGCLFTAFLLSRRLQDAIAEPIFHLARTASDVASQQNYSIRATKHSEDELGQLITAFNSMLHEIQTRDSALREARDNLEARVEERTRELLNEVAERRRTEEERDRFFTLSLDMLCIAGFDGYVLRLNPAFEKILGFTTEEMLTRPFIDLVHPDDWAVASAALQKLPGGEPVIDLEVRCICKDGSFRWIAWGAIPLAPECLFFAYGRDMTERKRAEEARHQSESQFRQVWNASADGMRVTNRDGTVLLVNDVYCRLVEKPRAELVNQSLGVIHDPEDRNRILQRHREQVDTITKPIHMEKVTPLGNGKEIWIDLPNSLLNLPGQPPLLLSIFRDISQRKHAEAELQETHRKLVETSRQAGMAEVATGVLHNVVNVLNSVNVSTTLVAEQLKKSKVANVARVSALLREHADDLGVFLAADPKGKQLLAYLEQLASHLNAEQITFLDEMEQLRKNIEHIKDIVAMQQSYARVSGVVEHVYICDLVEDALRLNAGALIRHEVQVVRNYANHPRVLIEKHKVLQVLVNLIRNAKYACDDSGRNDKRVVGVADQIHQ